MWPVGHWHRQWQKHRTPFYREVQPFLDSPVAQSSLTITNRTVYTVRNVHVTFEACSDIRLASISSETSATLRPGLICIATRKVGTVDVNGTLMQILPDNGRTHGGRFSICHLPHADPRYPAYRFFFARGDSCPPI